MKDGASGLSVGFRTSADALLPSGVLSVGDIGGGEEAGADAGVEVAVCVGFCGAVGFERALG